MKSAIKPKSYNLKILFDKLALKTITSYSLKSVATISWRNEQNRNTRAVNAALTLLDFFLLLFQLNIEDST